LPVLVVIGALIGIVIDAGLLAMNGLAVAPSLLAILLASLAGLVAAKAWYRALNPGATLLGRGWAVDGFLAVTPLAAVALFVAFGLPVGRNLDAAAPALFSTVAFGRVGCFLTGCCAGRMSASKWSVWSSNGTIGARRIPTQLIESLIAAVLAGVTTLLVAVGAPQPDGAVFITAMATYFIARTLLLRSRDQPRRFLWQRATAST
jgi:phosphatidylglycerol:prolipoprotein diacylglycerol transferase